MSQEAHHVWFPGELSVLEGPAPNTKAGKGGCSLADCDGQQVVLVWRGRWWGLCFEHKLR